MNGKPLLKDKEKPRKKKYTQKMCDAFLSPIVIKLYPKCLLCGKPTQVAHHFVHKSKSLSLRYHFPNLINLCHSCHFKLHFNEGFWSGKIIEIKGLSWFRSLEKIKYQTIKPNYEKIYNLLKSL